MMASASAWRGVVSQSPLPSVPPSTTVSGRAGGRGGGAERQRGGGRRWSGASRGAPVDRPGSQGRPKNFPLPPCRPPPTAVWDDVAVLAWGGQQGSRGRQKRGGERHAKRAWAAAQPLPLPPGRTLLWVLGVHVVPDLPWVWVGPMDGRRSFKSRRGAGAVDRFTTPSHAASAPRAPARAARGPARDTCCRHPPAAPRPGLRVELEQGRSGEELRGR